VVPAAEIMSDPKDQARPIDLRPAWRLADPRIERDAELFWQRERLLPAKADVTARLADVCMAAYDGDSLVGLTEARVRPIDFLRCKLAMFRCAVAREARVRKIASRLTVESRDLIEAWSRENPGEEVLGLGCVVQSRKLAENDRWAVWPDTKLAFIGYTAEGYQMRVYWFAHAKISPYWPGPPRGEDS